MLESKIQKKIIDEIKKMFPGCIVLKNDANYIQGFPDLTVLYKKKWALLETKQYKTASHRPNQDYYINKAKKLGFASFIFPENKEKILKALKLYFDRKD